jgi:hypothetical protein
MKVATTVRLKVRDRPGPSRHRAPHVQRRSISLDSIVQRTPFRSRRAAARTDDLQPSHHHHASTNRAGPPAAPSATIESEGEISAPPMIRIEAL